MEKINNHSHAIEMALLLSTEEAVEQGFYDNDDAFRDIVEGEFDQNDD